LSLLVKSTKKLDARTLCPIPVVDIRCLALDTVWSHYYVRWRSDSSGTD